MNTSPIFRASTLALGFTCMSAEAEWRCDCTQIVDTCSAVVSVEDNFVSIESDHLQCARVDYLLDGMPFVALVVDGRERQSWLSRNGTPRVLMQSCQVCLDNARGADAPAAATGATAQREAELAPASELTRLIAVEPQYPPTAAANGTEGFVDVSYTVTALGRVENASVTTAEPEGVFERAALAAIGRWRYSADEARDAVTLTHRFDFRAANARAVPRPTGASAESAIDSLIARSSGQSGGAELEVAGVGPSFAPRNQCIRERESYDFGEMVEANLMNTCNEPVMVYSCAEGIGRYQRRWVCHSTEIARSILVRPGDRLAGNVAMVEVPEGVRTYKYAEDLFVARARNTEYWWLACAVDDADCRGSGRSWTRSMNGKEAVVDPQLWTEQSVARSY